MPLQVTSDGQPIAAVVASSAEIAQRALQAVVVEYENLSRIITIQVPLFIINN